MPKICYVAKRFSALTRTLINHANAIIAEYVGQGYRLTLRQLYYQFVARDLIPNNPKSYHRLAGVVNDARLAGLIDWSVIEDRTRNLHRLPSWDGPEEIVDVCARTFRIDAWKNQDYRPEVWIEKEALSGVFERVCDELHVPFFACRGYTSQSEMWDAAQRLAGHAREGQTPVIFHFGDHDPSGIDMTRDIRDRLGLFTGGMEVKRLALNMDQVEEFSPPPNPARNTDSRFAAYMAEFGDESWELDALDPNTLSGLVRGAVESVRDEDRWAEAMEEIREGRRLLGEVSGKWGEITEGL